MQPGKPVPTRRDIRSLPLHASQPATRTMCGCPMMAKPSLLIWLGALVALLFAYTAQYGLHLQPCVLCLYQRIPYAVVLGAGVVIYLLRRSIPQSYFYGIALLAFVAGAGIAGFHVGVEQHWWAGTSGCGGAGAKESVDALRDAIMAAPVVRCDEPAAVFLGLSMTAWNLLYSLVLAAVTMCGWRKSCR